MNWKILNGVLFAGHKRIILAHVTAYHADGPTAIIESAGRCTSANAGAEAAKMVEAMDIYFQKRGEREENPLRLVTAHEDSTRKTLGTLITWLQRDLGEEGVQKLLEMLTP